MGHSRVERPSSTAAAVPLPRRGRLKKLPLRAVRRAANRIKGLLENALSLRTSAHAGVVPQGYFLRAQSPGYPNILAAKPSCFHPTGGLPHQ